MTDMFERAVKAKLRFSSTQGELSTEDLFDLSLTSLDAIAKKVNKNLQAAGEESFLPSTTTKASTNDNLRLDILKYVIDVKVQEQDDRKNRANRKAQLEQLKELANAKANEQLSQKSLEDIQKMIDELQAAGV